MRYFLIFLMLFLIFSCNESDNNDSLSQEVFYDCVEKANNDLMINYEKCIDNEYSNNGDLTYAKSVCSSTNRGFNDAVYKCIDKGETND